MVSRPTAADMARGNIYLLAVAALLVTSVLPQGDGVPRKFPDDFLFGVATSAYQIEGSWNLSDKGENIWDHLTHFKNELVADGSTGDMACDSVKHYKTDVQMVKDMGMDFYRFSISWSRILPTGFNYKISKSGIDYYNNLIDELLNAKITPFITLYHWDLPQPLQDLGGWANPLMDVYFEKYAEVAFKAFGDRVKYWLTFNEPKEICFSGYGKKDRAPAINMHGVAEYLCAHTVLKAHARVYHLYDKVYKDEQKGSISLTLSAGWHEPKTNSTQDIKAAERAIEFELGWFAHPIFHEKGGYPPVMNFYVLKRSIELGFPRSRLPTFSIEEVDFIKGTYDFFGINHYTSKMAREPDGERDYNVPSMEDDCRVDGYAEDDWPTAESPWLKVVPWGFRKLLNWIKNKYRNPEIFILENGYSDRGQLDDQERINYYKDYLNAVLDAIEDGCRVTAYTAWSLMDNFEWLEGYGSHFGLYAVDFNDPNRTRTPKASVKFFKDLVRHRYIGRRTETLI